MKKKIIVLILALIAFIPFVSAKSKKVKVYMFEAGGCPYCEAQEEYLKKLDGYGEKFELVKKELYVDHVDWEQGKDYELGVKVATEFNEAGFENATYEGTPFVVISDIYAMASYSEDLEDVINEAYEKGDKDIVGCFEKGKDDCLKHLKKKAKKIVKINYDILFTIGTIFLCSGLIILVYVIKSNKDKKELIKLLENKDVIKKEKKIVPSKNNRVVTKEKNKPIKRNSNKKNNNK